MSAWTAFSLGVNTGFLVAVGVYFLGRWSARRWPHD